MTWINSALLCFLLAAVLSPELFVPRLPEKAQSIAHLLTAGIQLLRVTFSAAGALSIVSFCFFRWSKPFESDSVNIPSRTHDSRHLVYVLVLTICAAILRLPNLNDSLWWDELNTLLRIVERGLPAVLAFSADGNNHLLNSVGMYLSSVLFGHSEWALRFPAFLLSVFTPPAAYFLTSRFLPRASAICFASLLALSFPSVVFGNEARGYAGGLLFTMMSSAGLVLLSMRLTRLHAFVYPLTAACATGFVATAIYIPIAHSITSAIYLFCSSRRGDRQQMKRWASILIICLWGVLASVVLIGIMVPQLIDYSKSRSHLAHAPVTPELIGQTLHFATGVQHFWVCISLVGAAIIGWYRIRHRSVILATFLGPMTVQLVAFTVQKAPASPRLFAPVIVNVLLGLSLLLKKENVSTWPFSLGLIAVLSLAVDSLPHYVTFYEVGQPPLRQLGKELAGKDVLLVDKQADMNVYYFPQANWTERNTDVFISRLRSRPQYVLQGFYCGAPPPGYVLKLGYNPVRTLRDWTEVVPTLHPGHVCFELYEASAQARVEFHSEKINR